MDNAGSIIENEVWHQRLIGPIRQALYANERPDAQRAHQEALDQIAGLNLAEDIQEAIHYLLLWYEFVISIQGQPPEHCRRSYSYAITAFGRMGETDLGEVQRRRLLAVLRCAGRLYGLDNIPRDELDLLIRDLPGIDDDEFLWHNIAGWAFAAGETDLLERAYAVMLTRPSNLLGAAKWQRVNMMLQLRNGKATRKDVAESIKGMEVLPQLAEFTRLIWPVCVEQGLVDAELEAELAEVTARIRANPPVPKSEPRTKKIRN